MPVTHLAHDTERDPLAILRAMPLRPGAPAATRYAALTLRSTPGTSHSGCRSQPEGVVERPQTATPPPQPPITLTAVDPASCVVTGAHYIELPVAYGRAKGGMISGTCKYCGLVKRYPAHIRWSRDGRGGDAMRGHAARRSRQPAAGGDGAGHSTWDVALDSLVHASGGSYHALEYVALAGRGIDAVHRHVHPKPGGPRRSGAGTRQRFRPLDSGR